MSYDTSQKFTLFDARLHRNSSLGRQAHCFNIEKNPHKTPNICGLTVNHRNDIVLMDGKAQRLKTFRYSGTQRHQFGSTLFSKIFVQPKDVAILSNRNIAIADPGDGVAKIYDRTGHYLLQCGRDLLMSPCSVTTNHKGEILLLDSYLRQVHFFTPHGHHLRHIPIEITQEMDDDCYIAVNKFNGDILLSDNIGNKVKAFSQKGELLWEQCGLEEGQVQMLDPCGICSDIYGNVFVAEKNNYKVTMLSHDGTFKGYIATEDNKIDVPQVVAIDNYGQLVVGEAYSGKVKFFTYQP
ncbi:tripartite motif-containing protein 2 [Lingula anatina]|uniref:Tripartite motif-containing protein 2 n=1 Tax=Lingula anatina TaxID=7574 RepID=A0A1S3K8Q4_LINAN|nr:tripartite motif-containing protein 2 [Lingula anatina]|eukprot:XP_013418824.1 tripartite motif-containing protein 2 [Lingula anatina]